MLNTRGGCSSLGPPAGELTLAHDAIIRIRIINMLMFLCTDTMG
jgi:hypothetical protein